MFWPFSHSKPQTPRVRKQPSGFGLVELMVTIGIMILVTSVIMVRHGSFNSSVLLRNQAYVVAFTIREVQQLAVSAFGDAANFRQVYGLHFSTDAADNQRYVTFRDADGDDYYDTNESYGAPNVLDSRFVVSEIRTFVGGTGTPRDTLSVTFVRPNFDANFSIDDTGPIANVDRAEIEIQLAGSGQTRIVEITSTGQITVQ